MTVMVAIVFAAAMPLSLNVGDMMFRKLLEKMVHPMRCSRGDKKPKRDGEAQVQAASEFRDWSSGIHLVVIRGYPSQIASVGQTAELFAYDALFHRELDLILGIQLSLMIGCYHAQFEPMFAWFDPVKRALFALKHAH